MVGNASNNIFSGGGGNDTIIGGGGSDTISFASSAVGVNVFLAAVSQTQGYSWDGTYQENLYNISNITGSSQNDYLVGNASNNLIEGGLGNDTMLGGLGGDTFIFNTTLFGNDKILDYQHGVDHLSFSTLIALSFSDFTITNNDTLSVNLTLNGGGTIVITGMSGVVHLDASDFLFV